MEALRKDEHYTYADYAGWNDNKRWELIDGVPYAMSPAPSWVHQSISSNLHLQFASFLKGKPCKVFHAPFDVRLNVTDGDDTVIQPDLVIICDCSKLSGTGYNGVPDMIIEILLPSTESRDKVLKFNKYLQASVREYWIVAPDSKTVQTYMLKDNEYIAKAYTDTDTAPVHILEGCTINLADVFTE